MRSYWRLASLLAATAAAGCAPTPHLAVAPSVLSRDWGVTEKPFAAVPREQFWHAFGSPDLERLIAAALANNPA